MSLFESKPLSEVVNRLVEFYGPRAKLLPLITVQFNPRRAYYLYGAHCSLVEGQSVISAALHNCDAFGAYQTQSHSRYRKWCKDMGVSDVFSKELAGRSIATPLIHHSIYGSFQCDVSLRVSCMKERMVLVHELSTLPATTQSNSPG